MLPKNGAQDESGDIRYTGSERYSYGWGVPSMDKRNVASFTYESVYGKLVWA
jgi:hypothetical protein